jgi:hypothetical protein
MIRRLAIAAGAVAAVAIVASTTACNDVNDVAGSRGALGIINLDAPSFAQSGVEFTVEIEAGNLGVSNLRDSRVEVTFESPLVPVAADGSAGTNVDVSDDRVFWDLGTLDSNTRSTLEVRTVATLGTSESSRSARIRAQLTARGISPGDAVATDFVTITR